MKHAASVWVYDDAVWISGRISTVRTDSFMGAASYRLEAVDVSPYQEKGK